MVQILPDVRLAGYPRVRGLGVDPGGNSAECFGFWKVLGIPNFQVAQEIFVDVQPNYGLWIFFRVIIGLDTFTFEAGSQWLFNSTAFCIE